MKAAGLTHGPPREVAEYLERQPDIGIQQVLSALINALNRISQLEHQVERLRKQLEE